MNSAQSVRKTEKGNKKKRSYIAIKERFENNKEEGACIRGNNRRDNLRSLKHRNIQWPTVYERNSNYCK